MTRVALTKLLSLVILAFIICLLDFFTLYRVSKVNFLCLPYRSCERGNQLEKGGNGKSGDAEIGRRDLCDPPWSPGSNKWEQDCTREDQSNATDPESDSGRGAEDPERNWFMCEADMDMAELQRNMSSSALKTRLEVSVELQLTDAETLNLNLYSGSNHSSLHLHPPGKEEEEEEEEGRDYEDEWRCVFRALWLALLCVVMLTIVTTVLGIIYWNRRSCKMPNMLPLGCAVTDQRLNDGEKHTEIIIPKGMIVPYHGSRPRTGLSPIQEVDTQDDIETLLDGNVDPCYTANLHHRIHPSISSLTGEQTC